MSPERRRVLGPQPHWGAAVVARRGARRGRPGAGAGRALRDRRAAARGGRARLPVDAARARAGERGLVSLAWTPSARLKQIAFERAQPLSGQPRAHLPLQLALRLLLQPAPPRPARPQHRPLAEPARRAARARHALRRSRRRAARTPRVPDDRARRARARVRAPHPDERRARDRGARRRASRGCCRWPSSSACTARRAETHDRATATPGSFAAMLRGLDRLRERGFRWC